MKLLHLLLIMEQITSNEFPGFLMATAIKVAGKKIKVEFSKDGFDGITRIHWVLMLRAKITGDGLPQSEIVELLMGNKTGVSRAVSELEGRGWIYRKEDPKDRRNKLIFLTEAGKSIFPVLAKSAMKTLNQATENISKQEMSVCKHVLKKIIKNLSSKGDNE